MEATLVVKVPDSERFHLLIQAVTIHAQLRRFEIHDHEAPHESPVGESFQPKQIYDLTPIDLQMMALAAEGVTRRRIGELLYLSPKSVSTYWRRIYSRLDLHSRDEVVRWYRKHIVKA